MVMRIEMLIHRILEHYICGKQLLGIVVNGHARPEALLRCSL